MNPLSVQRPIEMRLQSNRREALTRKEKPFLGLQGEEAHGREKRGKSALCRRRLPAARGGSGPHQKESCSLLPDVVARATGPIRHIWLTPRPGQRGGVREEEMERRLFAK